MKIKKLLLKNGDEIQMNDRSIVYRVSGHRDTMSTSALNGGFRKDICAVFNYDETPPDGGWCQMKAPTYESHLAIAAEEIGLKGLCATGLSTTVQMKNAVILREDYHGHEIAVVCTAGADVNATRAGESAGFDELLTKPDVQKGTINIILSMDVSMSEGALARAIMTLTEAKTAALQELMTGCAFTEGLATGTGTDGAVVIASPDSVLRVSNVGPHSKLGEIIGVLVKRAVKKSLFRQTGLDALRQLNVYERLKRYGVDEQLLAISETTLKSPLVVSKVSMVVHLVDQMHWGLLEPHIVLEAAAEFMKRHDPADLPEEHRSLIVQGAIMDMLTDYLRELDGMKKQETE